MSERYLLAIDPGLMTGIALIDISDIDNPVKVWSEEADLDRFYRLFPETVVKYRENLEIVCEDFIITTETAKKSPAPWSLNLIGIVKYFAWLYQVKMTLQKPSEREFMTNDRLRAFGFWHRGGAGHANDCMRHAGTYLLNMHRKLAKKLLK